MDRALAGERAVDALRETLAADPRHLDAFIRLRLLLDEQGEHEALAGLLEARLEVEPDLGEQIGLHRAIAELARNFLEDRERAKRHYRAIVSHSPADLRAIAALSDIAWEQGAWGEAADALQTRERASNIPLPRHGVPDRATSSAQHPRRRGRPRAARPISGSPHRRVAHGPSASQLEGRPSSSGSVGEHARGRRGLAARRIGQHDRRTTAEAEVDVAQDPRVALEAPLGSGARRHGVRRSAARSDGPRSRAFTARARPRPPTTRPPLERLAEGPCATRRWRSPSIGEPASRAASSSGSWASTAAGRRGSRPSDRAQPGVARLVLQGSPLKAPLGSGDRPCPQARQRGRGQTHLHRAALERLADLGIAGEWRMALGARAAGQERDVPARKVTHLHRVGRIFAEGFADRRKATSSSTPRPTATSPCRPSSASTRRPATPPRSGSTSAWSPRRCDSARPPAAIPRRIASWPGSPGLVSTPGWPGRGPSTAPRSIWPGWPAPTPSWPACRPPITSAACSGPRPMNSCGRPRCPPACASSSRSSAIAWPSTSASICAPTA
jgi:hypothetical protein